MRAKKYNCFIRILPALLLCWALSSFAQDVFEHGPLKIQRYTETDGLISAETGGVYKDRQGFLWIATFNGLSRFDGRGFENFGRQNGLTESNVDLIGEDEAGQLFIKSISNIYQYTGSKTTPFIKYPSGGGFIAAACPQEAGAVWVSYEGQKGLHLLSIKGELKQIATESPVNMMVQSNEKEVYVLEFNGRLSILKNGTLTKIYTVQTSAPFKSSNSKLYKDAAGHIWTYSDNNRYIYAHKGTAITDSIAVPPGTRWWQWSIGGAGNIYMASDQGSVFQLLHGQWKEVLTKTEVRGSIYDVGETTDGVVWVPTSGGLLRITRKQYQNALANHPVYYYTPGYNGRYILRSDSLLYTIPNAVRCFFQLQEEVITNVYVTSKKEVWYCTEKAAYYLPYGKALQKLPTATTYDAPVSRFRRVIEDGKGGVWVSSYHGIFYKNGDSLHYYWNKEGLTEGAIYTVSLDTSGTYYAAGVHVYACVNGRFQNISGQLHLPDEISRLAADRNNNVWVCQGTNKIIKIGKASNGFYVADSLLLSMNGLPVFATSHCFDAQNNLWVSDNRALYCYRFINGKYNPAPLYWNEALSGSPLLYADDSSNVQVISHPLAGNYLRTYSAQVLINNYQRRNPQLQLTGIRLFKENFDWTKAGFVTNTLGIPQQLVLRHNQNFLRFYFTGLTDDYNPSVAYRSRLSGYDNDWSPVTTQGEAEYTGLPPGRYTFEVQARSAGGEWSSPLSYSFTIAEVWYLLWWAKAIWALLLIGLLSGAIYYRVQSLKRKAQVKQLLVEEQLKALRAQINPHFLQNIFAFLAHELYSSQNVKAVKAIDRLSVYLKDVLRYSDKAAITLEEELEFAGEYLQMQQQLLSTKFTYTINVADDVDVFDIQVPSMLLQPILENALKYGLSVEKANEIVVTVRIVDNLIHCVISDTGGDNTGADAAKKGSGKGIDLTTERLQLFYAGKRNKAQFYRHRNADGGCDAFIILPVT